MDACSLVILGWCLHLRNTQGGYLSCPYSYCNSILQCLYYSAPFREAVITYPRKLPTTALTNNPNATPRPKSEFTEANGQAKPSTVSASARNPGAPVNALTKPEDKDSPEYKKKQAMTKGPVLPMAVDNASAYGMQESLFTTLRDIFETIITNKSRTGVIQPAKFLEVLRRENEMFRTPVHQDAHEFLNYLLNEVVSDVEKYAKAIEATTENLSQDDTDAFAKALATAMPSKSGLPNGKVNGLVNGSRSPSNAGWVHELFEGTLTSETRCLTCENVSQRDEVFLDLSVDLEQHSSVTSCLRKFSEEEMLCERNKFHCDNCSGLQEAEKRMKIRRLPKILALHLKRFKYTEDLQRLQKLFHKVVYPYHLRMFNTTDDAEDPDRIYELYAVVVHLGGTAYHGHYVSVIKTEDRGWLLFDDEMVEPVDKSYVQNFFGGDQTKLACAYVLFYQETTIEAVRREQEMEGKEIPIPTVDPTEAAGLGLSTNGFGEHGVSRVHSSFDAPIAEEHLTGLDHASTAPQFPIPSTSPKSPQLLSAFSPSSASPEKPQSKKERKAAEKAEKAERVKEEKERKIAAKEKEKADLEQRKENSKRLRDVRKQQADEYRAVIEASKQSAKEDEMRRVGSGGTAGGSSSQEPSASFNREDLTALPAAPPAAPPPASSINRSLTSRFRPKSIRLSRGSKDKMNGIGSSAESSNPNNESAVDTESMQPPATPATPTERPKGRMSFRKPSMGSMSKLLSPSSSS